MRERGHAGDGVAALSPLCFLNSPSWKLVGSSKAVLRLAYYVEREDAGGVGET